MSRGVQRRSLLLGLAGLPVLASCGLEVTRPGFNPNGNIAPAEPATLRQGGVLRWPMDEFPQNYNSNSTEWTADARSFVAALMPTTHTSDAHGNLTVRSEYFTSIEMPSTDPQTCVFTINPKAHWSDGTPMTWEDLKAQWQAMNGTNPDYETGTTTGYRDVADIRRGVDERQAIVIFTRHYADWRGLFSYLYPKSTNHDPESFNKGWILGRGGLDRTPVTAGPFKVNSFDEGQQRITLISDPNWWGRKPRLDLIVFMGLAPEAQIGALQNGEVDFASVGSSAPNLAIAQNTKGVDVRTGPNEYLGNLTFSGKPGGMCADVGLRRAVAMGIDRDRLAKTLLGAAVAHPTASYNLVFLQGIVGYEDHRDAIPHDPQAAKTELDQLGWKQQGKFRAKDGKQLTIRLVIPAQTASSANSAKILQQMLAEIGVNLVIDAVSSTSFLRDYVQEGNFDIALFSWGHTPYPTDIGSIYGLYKKDDGSVDPQQNYGQIGSEKLNELIAQMQAELNPDLLLQIGNEADKEIAQIVHSISLYQAPANTAVRSTLRNFGPVGIGDTDYTAIGYAQ